MKNIRSSKGQDGFIGALLGIIVGLAVLYYVVMFTLMVLVAVFVDNGTEEEKSGLSPYQFATSQEYGHRQIRYSCDRKIKVLGFDCDSTYHVWLATASGQHWALEWHNTRASRAWSQKYDRREIRNGDVYFIKADPKVNPCVFEFNHESSRVVSVFFIVLCIIRSSL